MAAIAYEEQLGSNRQQARRRLDAVRWYALINAIAELVATFGIAVKLGEVSIENLPRDRNEMFRSCPIDLHLEIGLAPWKGLCLAEFEVDSVA